MSNLILIKNGTIVNATETQTADALIQDGKIVKVSSKIESTGTEQHILNAAGHYLFPGGVDAHVHMELPVGDELYSSDDFLTGSRAAIAGGTTTIIDFVTPHREQSLVEAVEERKKVAAKSQCDYGFHVSVTRWIEQIPAQLKQCKEQYGIISIKLYMAYKQAIGLEDWEIIKVMDCAAGLGMLVTVHCEHDETIDYLRRKYIIEGKREPRYHPLSRPPAVEAEAVKRAILMAKVTNCPLYIVHVSTKDAVEEIAKAQNEGQTVYAETCPHYLLLDDSQYQRPGFEGASYIMSPPLRASHHKDALWDALKKNILHTVATDHCPFQLKDREARGKNDFTKIPNGVAGVEHRLKLLYSYGVVKERLGLERFVELTAEQPSRIFGLFPRKGIIAEGSDADMVIWNPETEEIISASTQFQNCDTTIYEGFPIQGTPRLVMIGGEIVFQDGGSINRGQKGGRYLQRNPVN